METIYSASAAAAAAAGCDHHWTAIDLENEYNVILLLLLLCDVSI